ncbi:MAG: (2Fe-2S)-binding protein [Candidatus Omnitrophica bacterium]|nr:(2Fe-2S)-binding protein [Candidatus Omnitrophota bacterium]
MKKIKIEIDGNVRELQVPDSELLIETLRERFGLLGTKYSCLEGDCGVCTVLVGTKNVLSCLILTADCDGEKITTIEGLATAGQPHPLQRSFIEKGAIQCGFCTPGMILAAKSLLDKQPHPSDVEIARALDGNLCRCTGYVKIIDAVREAAGKIDK